MRAAALLAVFASACLPGGREGVVHRNAEYGIETRFPTGIRVCTALSGYHPIGFYGWLDRSTDCDMPRSAGTSSISITASYNAAFQTGPDAYSCRDGSRPVQLDLEGVAFPNFPSLRCSVREEDGTIHVHVAAQGGRWKDSDLPPELRGKSRVFYNAWLQSVPARIGADLAAFRLTLAQTKLSPPEQDF